MLKGLCFLIACSILVPGERTTLAISATEIVAEWRQPCISTQVDLTKSVPTEVLLLKQRRANVIQIHHLHILQYFTQYACSNFEYGV